MKRLVVIVGPNAVGKTTTAKCLVKQLPKTAYVDSDWCRFMNPFPFTEVTKQTVTKNMYDILHNYLMCEELENVIFTYSWHGAGQKECEVHKEYRPQHPDEDQAPSAVQHAEKAKRNDAGHYRFKKISIRRAWQKTDRRCQDRPQRA